MRRWANVKGDLVRKMSYGGSPLQSSKRRELTPDELANKLADGTGRPLTDHEMKVGKLLVSRLWEDFELRQIQAKLGEMIEIDSLSATKRAAAIATKLSLQLDDVRVEQQAHTTTLIGIDARIDHFLGRRRADAAATSTHAGEPAAEGTNSGDAASSAAQVLGFSQAGRGDCQLPLATVREVKGN